MTYRQVNRRPEHTSGLLLKGILTNGLLLFWVVMPALAGTTNQIEQSRGDYSAVRKTSPPRSNKSKHATPVNLRPVFKKRGLSTRAQGRRGTCSVFTVTRAIEYALSEDEPLENRLSVEFLNWASDRVTGKNRDGSFFSDLWGGFERYGICDESQMPYLSKFDPNRQPSPQALGHARRLRTAGLQMNWIKPWDPKRGLNEEQFAAVKETLRTGWPVCGGFLWPKNPTWTKEGVLQMAARENVRDGHSVLLVGFRDDPVQPGGGVFLIQNTHKGRREGEMSYEYVRAYMNDALWISRVDSGKR